jgi:hypothetical protein
MKPLYQIEIKKPCSVDIDSMNSDSKGKFCSICQTSVIDFTNKSPDEIARYFQMHAIKNTCGTFNRWDVKTDSKIDRLIYYLQHTKLKFLAACVIGILVLSGCRIRRGGAPSYAYNGRQLEDTTPAKPLPPKPDMN